MSFHLPSSPSTSRSTKLSLMGVISVSARACAARVNSVLLPGVSMTIDVIKGAQPLETGRKLVAQAALRRVRSEGRRSRAPAWGGRRRGGTMGARGFRRTGSGCRWRTSRSMLATLWPHLSNATIRCIAVVDLPDPPFSLAMTMVWVFLDAFMESPRVLPRGSKPRYRETPRRRPAGPRRRRQGIDADALLEGGVGPDALHHHHAGLQARRTAWHARQRSRGRCRAGPGLPSPTPERAQSSGWIKAVGRPCFCRDVGVSVKLVFRKLRAGAVTRRNGCPSSAVLDHRHVVRQAAACPRLAAPDRPSSA